MMGLASVLAEASDLRIAAWNLEHLNDENDEGCVERSEEDLDAIAHRIEALGADVVAFQEVENEAAAQRVFDPAKWDVVMSSRPDTGEGPICYDRAEGRLRHQGTGIAIRRSVAHRRATDVSSLAGGNPYLRWGTHVVVGRGERTLHVLSVHLKSGCWGASQDEQGREACTVLRSQMSALRDWIDERQRNGERFAIAGDFNRRLAIPGDWAWRALSPEASPLELATAGVPSLCDARFPDFIDHIVLGGPDVPIFRAGSFREEARDGPHPDHCAISVAVADGPAGSQRTRVALAAWTAAFARTSTDQIAGGIERRLARGQGSFAAPGVAASVRDGGSPDLASLLSAGAFQLSPSNPTGGNRWTLWGAGATGAMSASEHDVRGRVRTATLGADVEHGLATLGVALSHSRGRGSTAPTGPIEAELATVAPYAAIVPREGVRLWAIVGKGEGKLGFEPTEGKPVRTDIETTLGALGLRADLAEAYAVQWSARTSAALTAFETGRLADLDPIDSRAGRLRIGIDGRRRLELHDAAVLTPSVELGLAHDAGDDASGTALELGAGLHYASPDGRLGADGHAKRYLAGGDAGGWEVGGQLVLNPEAHERGLSITLAPTWGTGRRGIGTGSHEAWNAGENDGGVGHLDANIAYGLALGGGRGTLVPYGGAEWTDGNGRAMRLGARWRRGEGLTAGLEGEFDARGNGSGAYALFAEVRIHW